MEYQETEGPQLACYMAMVHLLAVWLIDLSQMYMFVKEEESMGPEYKMFSISGIPLSLTLLCIKTIFCKFFSGLNMIK